MPNEDEHIVENKSIKYTEARKRAKKKVRLIKHLIIYISVNVIFAILNNVTSPDHQWWLWSFLIWGIILFIHWIRVKFDNIGNKILKKEMAKLGIKNGEQKVQQLSLIDESSEKVEQEEAKGEDKIYDQMSKEEKLTLINSLRKKAMRRIIFGLIWLFGGLIVSFATFALTELGPKVGFFNIATIVGIVLVIKGIIDNSKANKQTF